VRVAATLFQPSSLNGPIHFAASGDPESFRRYASLLLGHSLPSVFPLIL
jgi:hypothetical protein